jgi:hypothetical protein
MFLIDQGGDVSNNSIANDSLVVFQQAETMWFWTISFAFSAGPDRLSTC